MSWSDRVGAVVKMDEDSGMAMVVMINSVQYSIMAK